MVGFEDPPKDYATRPVAILGAGVLGRRIASTWSAAGYTVHIRDPSPDQLAQSLTYIASHLPTYRANAPLSSSRPAGQVHTTSDLSAAVSNAWLVIEAVPESLPLKLSTFSALSRLAPQDALLASNSSSYRSSEMLGQVEDPGARARILNAHYYMPPRNMVVELMTDGCTAEDAFGFLAERLRECGGVVYVARRESTGFIFNRLWAAVKREVLMILAEGVSVPEEVDELWEQVFVKGGIVPCKTMDEVGLDTVAFIENHYIKERGLPSEKTVDFLKKNYIDQGKLGDKCEIGGLLPPKSQR
ncbi:NAD(P)-binding protein [Corynespora cassiicola Philippines]|uniref:NAD(P)-binding protein n=1 Tax=Corynespora cassiicola Philippines TaxID=1448308 RepID=A0A2T2N6K5_CORCC|nr:NAD(P)-binding protein [Corynespora cassiicola Philippines]